MNTLQLTTCIKKEIWEYKKIFLWIPILLSVLILALPLLSIVFDHHGSVYWLTRFERLSEFSQSPMFSNLAFGVISMAFLPFIILAALIQLYYFVACLFDERRDMSILFWRSLPVSDAMSVGVKLFVGAFVIPAFFMVAATVTVIVLAVFALILCVILSNGYDISLWGMWANSGIIGHVAMMWLNLIPYALWLFPVYAWLMLMSMFANKAPFLWATLPIVVILIVESMFVHYFDVNTSFFANMLSDYFTFSHNMVNVYRSQNESVSVIPFSVIMDKVNWLALVMGSGFVYATYWLRRNRSYD